MKTSKKWIFISILLLIVTGIGSYFYFFKKENYTAVFIEATQKRTILEVVSASGKIAPKKQIKIAPETSGKVTELYVKEGDKVGTGQLLAVLDPDMSISGIERASASVKQLQASVMQAQARLTQLKGQAAASRTSLNRSKTLYAEQAITKVELERSEAEYNSLLQDIAAAEQTIRGSQFSLEGGQATYREASKGLAKTRIYAPESGTISSLKIEKGENVLGTIQTQGTEMMIIADLSEMEVTVEVNENDVVRVKEGDSTMIEVDAYDNRKFKGIVTQIANSPKNTNAMTKTSADQIAQYEVKITILKSSYTDLIKENNTTPFRPGMSATVDIITDTKVEILTIPINAVTTDKADTLDDATKTMREIVFVVKNNKVYQKPIKTGIQDDKYIEIIQGLEANEKIVIGPYKAIKDELKDSTTVTITTKEEYYKSTAENKE